MTLRQYFTYLYQSTEKLRTVFATELSCNKLFYNRGNLVDVDDTRAYSDTQKIRAAESIGFSSESTPTPESVF